MERLTDGKESKIRPLADVTPCWDFDGSRYPDRVKIPMADGTVMTYRIIVEMPKPQVSSLEMLSQMQYDIGYQARHLASPKTDRWLRLLAARNRGKA